MKKKERKKYKQNKKQNYAKKLNNITPKNKKKQNEN